MPDPNRPRSVVRMTLWDGHRVPMTLLGGYLGAGKTTIVNHVLADAGREGRRIAVLVNDLGTVNVDASLIAARHDDTIELANGCICCSLVDGLAVALETLRARPRPPDHVLVELSGVAEPARVVPWASTAGFRLDGVVVVADADQIRERAADHRLAGLVAAQLAAADLVLVSKTDLVDPAAADAVARWAAARSPAPSLRVTDGVVTADVLLGPRRAAGHPAAVHDDPPRGGVAADHHHDVVPLPAMIERGALEETVAALASMRGVVRVKGTVGTDDGSVLVQVVGPRWSVTPWEPAPGGSMVVIALDADALADGVARVAELAG